MQMLKCIQILNHAIQKHGKYFEDDNLLLCRGPSVSRLQKTELKNQSKSKQKV